ncbi:MAG: hypothetical protein RIN53_13695, partial [Gammaproteobacteria bacterium]
SLTTHHNRCRDLMPSTAIMVPSMLDRGLTLVRVDMVMDMERVATAHNVNNRQLVNNMNGLSTFSPQSSTTVW